MGSRRAASFFAFAAFALLWIAGSAFYSAARADHSPNNRDTTLDPSVSIGTSPLIIEPDDGMAPVAQFIMSASSSIDMVMYELEDKQLESLLAQKAAKGIAVRVILDNGYFGAGSAINQEVFDYLRGGSAQVHWSPQYFALTHEKSIVVDGREALVMTFNLTPHYYKSDRDLGIVDEDPNDVAAIESAFDADWNGRHDPAPTGDHLVWSPDSRERILSFIDSATSSLEIYNEEMQDPQIISSLDNAAARGVDVELLMTYSSNWKAAFTELSKAGVHVRTYKTSAPLYIHAKAIVADHSQAFVGSQNFSSNSLDQNRELGLVVSDPQIVSQLERTFAKDRQGATAFLVQ